MNFNIGETSDLIPRNHIFIDFYKDKDILISINRELYYNSSNYFYIFDCFKENGKYKANSSKRVSKELEEEGISKEGEDYLASCFKSNDYICIPPHKESMFIKILNNINFEVISMDNYQDYVLRLKINNLNKIKD